jgi:hypothetical protein
MNDPREAGSRAGKDRAAQTRRDEKDAIESAVSALDGPAPDTAGERPEALSQLAQSAREGERSPKDIAADIETAPEPQSNVDKHDVASRILKKAAEGEHPDPREEGADRLPDRIIDRG